MNIKHRVIIEFETTEPVDDKIMDGIALDCFEHIRSLNEGVDYSNITSRWDRQAT